MSSKNHHIHLNAQARLDLLSWHNFLSQFNAKCLMSPRHWVSSAHNTFFSDAWGRGYAAVLVLRDRWIHGSFPPQWKDVNIATKELVPIYFAFSMWAPILSNKNIIFLVDNRALVDRASMIVSSSLSKSSRAKYHKVFTTYILNFLGRSG